MKEGAKRMQQERNIVCQIRKRRSRIEYTRKEEGGGGEWDKVETAASLARWTEPGTDLILEHVFTANKPTTFSPPLYPLCFTLSSSLVQTAQRGSTGHTTAAAAAADIQAMTIATAAHATHHDEKRTKERCHTRRTRKLTRYRDTISLSRDIAMMWQRQWWTHYCWECINSSLQRATPRLPISARENINQKI